MAHDNQCFGFFESGADVIEREMQYLYSDGHSWTFMDQETFEQVEADGGRVLAVYREPVGDNWQAFADLAKAHKAPMAIRAASLSTLAELTEKIKEAGVPDIVLDRLGFSGTGATPPSARRSPPRSSRKTWMVGCVARTGRRKLINSP